MEVYNMIELKKTNKNLSRFRVINKILFVFFAIVIITVNTYTPTFSSNATDISPSNHAYPIYNVLSLRLNNHTNGELLASVKIYNDSINRWTVNTEFLNFVENDLQNLSKTIVGVNNITMYSINDTVLPGIVNLFVITEGSESAETACNSIITIMQSYWYVEDITIPHLDLRDFDPGNFGDFRELAVFSDDGYALINVQNGYWTNATEQDAEENYALVLQFRNNSYFCIQRNNITASPWLWNGTYWTPNKVFIDILHQDAKLLTDGLQKVMNELNISISPLYDCYYNQIRNFTEVAEGADNELISIPYKIVFDTSLSRNEQLHLYFLLYSLLGNLWYARSVNIFISIGYPSTSPSPLMISTTTIGVLVIALISQYGFHNKRKKTKLYS